MDELADTIEEKTVRVLYNFSVTTRLGHLPISSTDVIVDLLPLNSRIEEYYHALSLSSNHFLVCKFIDHLEKAVVYQRFDQTIWEYVLQLKKKKINPVMKFTVPSSRLTPYDYMPNEYRTLVKSMIEFIVELHLNNHKSLRNFSLDNMVIKHGILKFWKLRFLPATEHRRKADFRFLERVIKKLFEDQCPPILTDLLTTMTHPQSIDAEKRLTKHLAILSSPERLTFLKGCFDKREDFNLIDKKVYERAVASMGNNSGWAQNFFNDNVGRYGPLKECFIHGQQQNSQQNSYMYKGDIERENLGLLRFFWNSAAHLRSHIRECIDDCDEINDECVELSIMAVFERQLLRFQQELYNVGLLDRFI